MYIYQRASWPKFIFDWEQMSTLLASACLKQGKLLKAMDFLGFEAHGQTTFDTLTENIIKTSEIEGERLDIDQVRSSLAKRLDLPLPRQKKVDRHVEGIVDLTLDVSKNYLLPLTQERLFSWHNLLFPTGYSGFSKIVQGQWRDDIQGPMRVVSGPIGNEKVHFEAPSADKLSKEMSDFLTWYNENQAIPFILKAGIAHLWFVTLHPFEDGNGRIARAITDMMLARGDGTSERFYSMSSQIQKERAAYYTILEHTQKGNLDITKWLVWFLNCLERSIDHAQEALATTLNNASFWSAHKIHHFNERQVFMLNKLLDGFEGKLTSKKWAIMTKTSQDTAHRDILDLIDKKVLVKNQEGGRSTSYSLI